MTVKNTTAKLNFLRINQQRNNFIPYFLIGG